MLLINADRQFKVLVTNYISIFVLTRVNSRKKSQIGNERKNRSVRNGHSRAQKMILAHRALNVQ